MSADLATDAAAMMDPRKLTTAERAAMTMIHDHRLFANAGGYYGRLPHRITRQLAAGLIARGLVRIDHNRAGDELMLTGKGLATRAVMMARRERRQA
ncbi:hypothetical protein [Mesorhizobium sp. M1399]|uniref:hypothetical protein n=1 Tax=Mesorhizobium sp. M1399 TaxID=2957096 RepID=UPI0033371091